MLCYDRIDVNKTSKSKECNICHYWYFLNKGFKFQPSVCNGYHDLLMMSLNLSNIVILNIKGADYRCIISATSKSEAINLMKNNDLTKKAEHHKTQNLLLHIKIGREILTFGDIKIGK